MATLRDDLVQRDLEAYEEAINTAGIGDMLGAQRIAGTMVRGAVAAGWFTDLTTADDVGSLKGKEVKQLYLAVNKLYGELVAVDPL